MSTRLRVVLALAALVFLSGQSPGYTFKEFKAHKRYSELATTDVCFKVESTNAVLCVHKKSPSAAMVINGTTAHVTFSNGSRSSKGAVTLTFSDKSTVDLVRGRKSGTATCDGTEQKLTRLSGKEAKAAIRAVEAFRVPKAYRKVFVTKTKSGTIVAAMRDGWAESKVWVGTSPDNLKEAPLDRVAMKKDGGTTTFYLKNGGRAHFPVNHTMTELFPAKGKKPKTYSSPKRESVYIEKTGADKQVLEAVSDTVYSEVSAKIVPPDPMVGDLPCEVFDASSGPVIEKIAP